MTTLNQHTYSREKLCGCAIFGFCIFASKGVTGTISTLYIEKFLILYNIKNKNFGLTYSIENLISNRRRNNYIYLQGA